MAILLVKIWHKLLFGGGGGGCCSLLLAVLDVVVVVAVGWAVVMAAVPFSVELVEVESSMVNVLLICTLKIV